MSEEKLKEIYYNPKTGFQSLKKIWERVKEDLNMYYNDVKKWLEQQKPHELTKQVVKPKEFSNIYAEYPLQYVQIDIMIYDRFEYHNYKYVLGVIDVYSRYASCRALTNMRMETIMEKLKDILDNDFSEHYPKNINCDNQFNVTEFTDFFTNQGTNLWFSQPEQPHKNAIIERFWRTLALLLHRMREGIKNFDWPKALPDVIENYNETYHKTLKAKPIDVLEGKKDNPVERKVVDSVLKKGMRVRIKAKKNIFSKGDVQTFSRDIYQIIEKEGQSNTLRNLTTGKDFQRTYTDEELDQTFDQPESPKAKPKRREEKEEQELELVPIRQNPAESIARRREKRAIKAHTKLNL
jgi:transposase InsO family protein